ncbi:hypothetical protein D3C85_281230 [compost metagenome]
MATIATVLPANNVGSFVVSPTLTTGADTFVYKQSAKQVLFIKNDSASPAAIVVDGADGTTIDPGVIGATINVAPGYTITVPAGQIHCVLLSKIRAFLNGTIAVTGGGADVFAWIVEL